MTASRAASSAARSALEDKSVDLLPFGKDGKLLSRLRAYTEEDGSFQFTKLPPGRYVLGVNTFDEPDKDLPYRKTFYPLTTDPSAAEVITLGEGQHLSGFDFRMPAPLVAREITGTVVWPDGRPAVGAEVQLGGGRVRKAGQVRTED